MTTQSKNRVEGRWVLAMLTALVVACMAIMLIWRHLTPPVPDARQRRRQFALPGVDVDLPSAPHSDSPSKPENSP